MFKLHECSVSRCMLYNVYTNDVVLTVIAWIC